ncbi:hypothetical protein EDD76_12121 [Kineothrix alysoides]|uniref:Damage-control phosphatase ARMT1-like metal-binding domain-containing protein n=1 Tax=Kineothrix alysoides TaxID=1469948 RepID=A0A4V6NGJ6_9FIRM|nr:ARMT1-like domain-containing protein [Kineothrix alysoides]TCL54252.1 hypothetical protein EDD76_12121 [Kineothrix alysoides]
MKLSSLCIRCLIDRQEERIRSIEDENKKAAYMKEVAGIIGSAESEASAPFLVYKINCVYKRYFGEFPDYEREKEEFNSLMLSMEEELEEGIRMGGSKEEILSNALNYARTANYIDYGAMNQVSRDKLLQLLNKAREEKLEEGTFRMFQNDLLSCRKLVYLTDNCGEIVADKLLIKILKEQYPDLHIKVIVRGMAVLNDATIEEAKAVGLTEIVEVIGNGNGIAGTQISHLSDEARQAIGEADVIISKGQGNFETIHGCGLNIYYLFLCKCEWFTRQFDMERLKGVFINEKNVAARPSVS